MADYYPLIARAVAGLGKDSPEARRSLYDRARSALLTKLSAADPQFEESIIAREQLALEGAIRKVEVATPSATDKVRRVRVFVSSTFRDMQAERDHLVKFIFPQLRKICEARGIGWTEVDLRWGIPDEDKDSVLPLCLAEIERCRPFFIGLLGERYGHVPQTVNKDLLESLPWLADHQQSSITELEILHGALNHLGTARHTYFYFRDPVYVDRIPPDGRSDFLAESSEHVRRLKRLKDRIRAASHPLPDQVRLCQLREPYRDVEELGRWVLDDFSTLIDSLFAAREERGPFESERLDHEAFAQSRTGVFVGRQRELDRISEHVQDESLPLVVTGEPGSGKSALLARWCADYRARQPSSLTLSHFIGATPAGAESIHLIRRIMHECRTQLPDLFPDDLPVEADKVREVFPKWLALAAENRPVVLILDGLDQLEDRDFALELGWLPEKFPPNCRVVVSAATGPSLDALRRRRWPELAVQPLSVPERKELIAAFLGQYSRRLGPARVEEIASAAQTGNPLFLCAVLDELRQFGEHERLGERTAHYLSASGPVDLYGRIIERWQHDYGQELVRQALGLTWGARRGLSESELLELLGKEGQPLPRVSWTPFYLAAESSLISRSSLLSLANDHVRQAVTLTWLHDDDERMRTHERLASYFGAQPLQYTSADERPTGSGPCNTRKVDEHLWQLSMAGNERHLYEALLDMSLLLVFTTYNRMDELIGYWAGLNERFPIREGFEEVLTKFRESTSDPKEYAMGLNALATVYRALGFTEDAAVLLKTAVAELEASPFVLDDITASSHGNIAILEIEAGRLDEGEKAMLSQIGTLQRVAPGGVSLARAYNNLTSLYLRWSKFEEAMGPNVAALAILEKENPLAEPLRRLPGELANDVLVRQMSDTWQEELAAALQNRGLILASSRDFDDAIGFGERAVHIARIQSGVAPSDRAKYLFELSSWYNDNRDLEQAALRLTEAEEVASKLNDEKYSEQQALICAALMRVSLLAGKIDHARARLPGLKTTLPKIQHTEHPNLLDLLGFCAGQLHEHGFLDEAEETYRMGVELGRRCYKNEGERISAVLNNLGQFYYSQREFQRSLECVLEALVSTCRSGETGGLEQQLQNIAAVLLAMGDQINAATAVRDAFSALRRSGQDEQSLETAEALVAAVQGKVIPGVAASSQQNGKPAPHLDRGAPQSSGQTAIIQDLTTIVIELTLWVDKGRYPSLVREFVPICFGIIGSQVSESDLARIVDAPRLTVGPLEILDAAERIANRLADHDKTYLAQALLALIVSSDLGKAEIAMTLVTFRLCCIGLCVEFDVARKTFSIDPDGGQKRIGFRAQLGAQLENAGSQGASPSSAQARGSRATIWSKLFGRKE
jgi:tetratricopeptide (TPR) repeat protein